MVTAVFLAGGASRRFGGKIKGLAKVGPNNEALLEVSMSQAIAAGIDKLILIVNEDTFQPIKNAFGSSFKDCPVSYCFQNNPPWRKKPLGHAHALLSARYHIDEPFILSSSDDLVGVKTWEIMVKEVERNNCVPGFLLSNTLPPKGKVNRAILMHKNNHLVDIQENYGISNEDIPEKYSGDEYAAMLVFGLHPDFLDFLEPKVTEFIRKRELQKELITSNVVNDFIKETKAIVKVLETPEIPLFLTYPEDEAIMREKLFWLKDKS